METIFERCAALDVHKAQVTACFRVPAKQGRVEQEVAEFKTTVQGLLTLRDWLEAHMVTHVAMEATGGVLEAGFGDPRGPVRVCARQRPSRQAGAGP